MTEDAKPRFLWKGWAPGIAVLVITLISLSGFFFADAKTDHAVKVAKNAAVAEATRESKRADDAICRIARTNRTQSIVLLVAFQDAIVARPNPDPDRQAENVALVEGLLAEARAPFPEPCTRYTPTL